MSRLCLSLGVVPVFAPVSEHVGEVPSPFQAQIEGYNGLWQAKVWAGHHHGSLAELVTRSEAYVAAHRRRSTARREGAPTRRRFPDSWRLDLQAHPADSPAARVVFICRTDEHGRVRVLGHVFEASPSWTSRLVRCEVDLAGSRVRLHRLRRREPTDQPLLTEHEYTLPRRPFSE